MLYKMVVAKMRQYDSPSKGFVADDYLEVEVKKGKQSRVQGFKFGNKSIV